MKLFVLLLICTACLSFQNTELAKSIARGKTVYTDNCIACHMAGGEGVKGTFPPLAKSDYLKSLNKTIYAIKFGQQGKIKVNNVIYDNAMPNPGLDDNDIADVVNYIQNSWGNTSRKKMVTVKMVEAVVEKQNP